MESIRNAIRAAEVVLPAPDLDATRAFFVDELGFRVDAIFPADDPVTVVVSGHGIRLRLERHHEGSPGCLRVSSDDIRATEQERLAPNGTRILLVPAEAPVARPKLEPAYTLVRSHDAPWVSGRAGMRYRDLIPGRQGGSFLASHIHIPDGGKVPDYVHYHRVHFQMIYCHRGWVRVVYEDQGEPFVLNAGDCVVQPPTIRHRVLECGAGLEVIEVGSPANHETLADHELTLPTTELRPERLYEGQRFVRHVAAEAEESAARMAGYMARDLGIAEATSGVADARVLRCVGGVDRIDVWSHDAALCHWTLLEGAATLRAEGEAAAQLVEGDAVTVPAGRRYAWTEPSENLRLLQVTLPGTAQRELHGGAELPS